MPPGPPWRHQIAVTVARRPLGGANVRSSNPGLSNIPTRGSNSRRPPQRQSAGPATSTNLIGDAAGIGARIAAAGDINTRRLIGDQQYFGLEAKALRTGAARMLARISTRPP